jgi:hypothetical protein
MWKKVENYALNFHNVPRRTAIHLKLEDGSDAIMEHLSIEEFTTLGTILREEVHIWFHTTRGDLTAHSAPLHEEDLD